MKRPRVVAAIGIALSAALCLYGIVAGDRNPDNALVAKSGDLRLPAIMSIGNKGEILYDLHATLNSEFKSPIEVPESELWYIERGKTGWLKTKEGTKLYIPRDWRVAEWNDDKSVKRIEFEGSAIKSFGVYGDETYAFVTLFQIREDLRRTGEVDAITFRHLEPLRPASRPVLNVLTSATESWIAQDTKDRTGIDDRDRRIKSITAAIAVLLILLVSVIAYQVARFAAHSIGAFFERRFQLHGDRVRTSRWFDQLRQERVFIAMAHFAPALVLFLAQFVFPDYWIHEYEPGPIWAYPGMFFFWNAFFAHFGLAYIIFSLLLLALGFVNTCEAVWSPNSYAIENRHLTDNDDGNATKESDPDGMQSRENEGNAETALSGVIRFARGAVKAVGIILICAALVGQSPLPIIGGLGAFTAIILFVFKDSILGLVASVNIVAHKTVRVGDWIEMPKYDVDGDVASISLTTIKVCNFDKTIVSIPTYSVMADSFKNWRGMREAGGRRIKRAINIDMNTIRPVNLEMCERFEAMTLLTEYIDGKRDELREHLMQHNVLMSPANSRWLTNVGTYRVYLEKYLEQHAAISPDLTCLVRQLKPTPQGLPIEIYAFANETNWKEYERIQADILDHAISVLREFELRVFQTPSEYSYKEVEIPPIDHTPWHEGLERLRREVDKENQRLAKKPRASVADAKTRIEKIVKEIADEIGGSTEFHVDQNGRSITVE